MLMPMLVDQLFIVTLPMANAIIVSSLGQNSLSGVSIIDQVNLLIGNLVVSIAFGATVVVAQSIGRKDPDGVKLAVRQSYSSSLMVALFFSACMLLFSGTVVGMALR